MQSITFEQLPQAISQLHEKLEHLERLIVSQSSHLQLQPQPDELLTIDQAADFLHISRQTLYGKVHAKEVPYSKPGKRLYFSRAELAEWVMAGRRKTGAEIAAAADHHNAKRKQNAKS